MRLDYIREELLRQRAALTRLLLGWRTEEPLADSAEGPLTAERALGGTTETGQLFDGMDATDWESVQAAGRAPGRGTAYRRERTRKAGETAETWEEALWGLQAAGEDGARQVWMTGPRNSWYPAGAVRYGAETAAGGTDRWDNAGQEIPARQGSNGGETAAGSPGGRLPSGGGMAREYAVTEAVWSGTEEAGDPKTLSLAYQRDARRYDGAFRLY
jgi:hypothetical protein